MRQRASIAVIRVGMTGGRGSDAMKPLIFPILADLTPPDFTVAFYDDRVEDLPESIDADIIALSVETFAARRAYALARQYKSDGNVIIMGGYHPTALPEECLAHCDAALVGDAEDTFPAFLKDYQNGTLQRKYISRGMSCLSRVRLNHPCFDGKRYAPVGVAQFSRGCKFACDFCSIKTMYSGKVRQKHTADIVSEMREAKEKLFFLLDDNIFLDENSALELFEALRPLKKKWVCQISMDVTQNSRLLRAMRKSGCVMVIMGFESLSAENLRAMNKTANLQIDYDSAVRNLSRHGLLVYATFVLGYDGDGPDAPRSMLRFANKHSFAIANFNPLIPMPETPLYKRLEREGRLLWPAWWAQDGYRYGDTVFTPRGMTPDQLRDGCRDARYSFYSLRGIWGRLLRNPLHWRPDRALVFLAANYVSRAEIRRKQGTELG